MNVRCDTCHEEYDDTYHDTLCPHNRFAMHTIIAHDREVFVATTLDDLEAIQLHFAGVDTGRIHEIQATEHRHDRDGTCLTPETSGRLI